MATLSLEKIREQAARNGGYVTGFVEVWTDDLLEGDLDSFLDLLSEGLVGSITLMDISYEAIRVTGAGALVYQVTGDASYYLNSLDPNDQEVA